MKRTIAKEMGSNYEIKSIKNKKRTAKKTEGENAKLKNKGKETGEHHK